jgi:murein DD-endopeptidase MepM/ murein hydrolase activator NlpD
LAAYRSSGGQTSSATLDAPPGRNDRFERESDRDPDLGRYDDYVDDDPGRHEDGDDLRIEPARPTPSSLFRSRAVFAAVTLGALTAAAAGQSLLPHSPRLNIAASGQPHDVAVVVSTDGDNLRTLEVQPAARPIDVAAAVAQLTESQRLTSDSASTAAYVKPADGTVTSGFGGSYGTMHYGIEIAGNKDAPIYAAANGVIIAAGPVSGFGMWVKERLSDGTTLVYARMDDFSVQVGQQVTAGQQIARMGDRGFATGYTLHFEVWNADGKKIDPEQWLNQRGIIL